MDTWRKKNFKTVPYRNKNFPGHPSSDGSSFSLSKMNDFPLAALADQAVEKLFRKGTSPHHMDALQDILSMLKNKSNSSLSVGWSVD